MLNSERFCDQAPAQIWATLLDEGRYLASVSTMYRILRSQHQVHERRRQARHPAHVKPELVANGPNQVWSWDITKLAGPYKWNWFHLYVILDVYSRYAVGWLVAPAETDRLAHELIATCVTTEQIPDGQLTLHADRGSSIDLENRRPTPRRPGRHPLTLKTPRLQRQPLLRSPIQNPEEHTTIPRTLHQPRPRPNLHRRLLRPWSCQGFVDT